MMGLHLLLGPTIFSLALSLSHDPGPLCVRAEDGSVLADGVTTDWQDVPRSRLRPQGPGPWDGARDFGVTVACQYTSDHVFFLFRIRDDYVVRFKDPSVLQDSLILRFSGWDPMYFLPSDGRQPALWGLMKKRHRHRVRFLHPPGFEVVLYRLADGYGLEMGVSADKLPGYRPGGVALMVGVQALDVDSKARARVETRAEVKRFSFQEADLLLRKFLSSLRLKYSQIKLNKVANFVTGPALERAVIVDRYLAVMGGDITGGGWYYLRLPVARSRDILRFAVRDMDGDGQPEILVRLRQAQPPKEREVLLIYRYEDTGGISMIFGHEVVHKEPGRILVNKYRYIRHGKGYDLEFWIDRCRGFTKENHGTNQPKDIEGILTPWGGLKKMRYRFTQAGYEAVE